MSRTVQPMSPITLEKVRNARMAVASQKRRTIRCQYCHHNAIVVFEGTRGHVQTKCKHCGNENVFDVLSMRRMRKAQ